MSLLPGHHNMWAMITYGVVGFIVLLAVQYTILKYTFLRPLEQTKKQFQALHLGDIVRLNEAIPSELQPLVKKINSLLDSLDQRLDRSRKALGNLAHALKTPLAVLIQLSHSEELSTATSHILVHKTQEIQNLIDRELKQARLSGCSQFGHLFFIEPEVRQLTDTLKLIYQSSNIVICSEIAPGARFHGDNQDFMELLGNLGDNACKWAKSIVKITAQGQDALQLTIEDDGPGIAQQQGDTLLRRGTRLDEQRVGSGLGLSIVKDIIEMYGGTIRLDRSPELGGLRVRVDIGRT